jgi:hypothetical protein
MGTLFGWRGSKAAGKDFVQLDRHPHQPQSQQPRNLIAALFDSAQIDALAGSSLEADPVADLDGASFVEVSLQNDFTRPAAPLSMEFKPTTADRPIIQNHRGSARGRTVVQDLAHIRFSGERNEVAVSCAGD